MTKESLLLLFMLYVCHTLADYTWLSTKWMLIAKSIGRPIFPIFTHAYVHSTLMLGCMLIIGLDFKTSFLLSIFQLVSHTIIDTAKGKMNVYFPSVKNPANKIHWVVFGVDQLFHFVVIILMVYIALKQND